MRLCQIPEQFRGTVIALTAIQLKATAHDPIEYRQFA
jgi:hypothetical protein